MAGRQATHRAQEESERGLCRSERLVHRKKDVWEEGRRQQGGSGTVGENREQVGVLERTGREPGAGRGSGESRERTGSRPGFCREPVARRGSRCVRHTAAAERVELFLFPFVPEGPAVFM